MVGQVKKHKLEGRVTAFTTDCEPSMVKAGRLVEEQGVAKHHDCCNRRLERITGIVFNGPGVLERPWRSHGWLCGVTLRQARLRSMWGRAWSSSR